MTIAIKTNISIHEKLFVNHFFFEYNGNRFQLRGRKVGNNIEKGKFKIIDVGYPYISFSCNNLPYIKEISNVLEQYHNTSHCCSHHHHH